MLLNIQLDAIIFLLTGAGLVLLAEYIALRVWWASLAPDRLKDRKPKPQEAELPEVRMYASLAYTGGGYAAGTLQFGVASRVRMLLGCVPQAHTCAYVFNCSGNCSVVCLGHLCLSHRAYACACPSFLPAPLGTSGGVVQTPSPMPCPHVYCFLGDAG